MSLTDVALALAELRVHCGRQMLQDLVIAVVVVTMMTMTVTVVVVITVIVMVRLVVCQLPFIECSLDAGLL